MPSKCFVSGCRSNYSPSSKVRVFSFPRDEALKKLWLQAVHRKDKREPTKASKICEQHFKLEDIITEATGFNSKTREIIRVPLQKHRLRANAVPSIFNELPMTRTRRQLPRSSVVDEICIQDTDESQDSIPDTGPSLSCANMRRCCVPGCRSNYAKPYVSVFQFPKSSGFRNLWLKKIGRPFLNVTDNSAVCVKHFEKQFIVDKRVGGMTHENRKKRVCIKPGSVPTIFDTEEVDSLSDDDTDVATRKKSPEIFDNVRNKGSRSASISSEASKEPDDESLGSPVSEKVQSSPTTDRPFIAVIKHGDSRTSETMSVEESNEDIKSTPTKASLTSKANSTSKSTSSKSNPNNLPSPYKHLPTVTVCLKEEDRVNAQRELGKAGKRSLSVCSNDSSEVVKQKRRKIEKPPPTVIGRQNDVYCWVCHRENVVLSCIGCSRAYHQKCSGETGKPTDFVCSECKRCLSAESVDSRSSILSEITIEKLCTLLRFSLTKMKHRAGVAFHQPVSLEQYPMYLHYIIHPMDFSLLEKNIKQKLYGCTEAFLSDVKWILHNSCVFNGNQHPLSSNAKSLVKACEIDMQEIEVCPDCFMHNAIRNKYWFSEVCRKPHPLVWAKLKGFPYWPAKVVRIADGNIDARFFGAHDRAWVPISQCYHLSKEMPTSSKPKKKGNYETALDELSVHVQLLIQKLGTFEYAPYRTSFDPENKLLMYHGIDIDQVGKDEIQSNVSSSSGDKVSTSSKEIGSKPSTESIADPDKPEVNSTDAETTEANANSTPQKNSCDSSAISTSELDGIKVMGNFKQTKAKDLQLDKNSDSVPNSCQLNKIELALQRIKGYVSVGADDVDNDPDPEKNLSDSKESTPSKRGVPDPKESTPDEKSVSYSKKSAHVSDGKENLKNEARSFLPSFLKSKHLPTIDIPSIEESSEKENIVVLDTAKKNDSFSLKLIETIESCKAKLGISGSSELLEKAESIDSDSVEEEEDEDEDEELEEEEQEVEDFSDQNDEQQQKDGKGLDKVATNVSTSEEDATDESSSESDDDSNSVSSNTDIEITEDIDNSLPKEANKTLENHLAKNTNEKDSSVINSDQENNGHSSISVTAKTIGPEKLGDGKTHETEEGNVNKESVENKPDEIASQNTNPEQSKSQHKETPISSFAIETRSLLPETLQINTTDVTDTEMQPSKIISPLESETAMDVDDMENLSTPTNSKTNNNQPPDKIEEDDDIYICNSPPVRPPTPPLICLDDGTETEPEPDEQSESDLNKIDSPINSHPSRNLPPVEKIISFENTSKYASILAKAKLISSNARKSVKRQVKAISPEESSDEEIQFVSNPPKIPLFGAKRTFSKQENTSILISSSKKNRPRLETVHNNFRLSSEVALRQQSNLSAERERRSSEEMLEGSVLALQDRLHEISPDGSIQNSVSENPNSPVDKDAEIVRLKQKLGWLYNKYVYKLWKHTQEKAELKHSSNAIRAEMRAVLELDKKIELEILGKSLEHEKQRCEEVKKKQWCACCQQLSRYACCWNTSYCSVTCQKRHFGKHRNICAQLKSKVNAGDTNEGKSKVLNEPKDSQKVFVVNMLPQTDAKSSGDSKQENIQQVSLSQVMSPKNSLQLVTSSGASNSSVQFMLAPLKPSNSPISIQPKPSTLMTDNSDCAELDNNSGKKTPGSKVSLLQSNNPEGPPVSANKEETVMETSLEEFYFPSPPAICFEGLDTALPDENIQFPDFNEVSEKYSSDTEQAPGDSNHQQESSADEEPIISDNEEADNEMVSIGRGIEIKAKFLNKCLIYGKNAKRLTRCLVDVIFPDVKLLAACSAFGNKSNVTKLTRAALPHRKVEAIIDFVLKRYPEGTRTEIVLAINMKCKEARMMVGRTAIDSEGNVKKTQFCRLLAKEHKPETKEQKQESMQQKPEAKEQKQETNPTTAASTSPSSQAATTITVYRNAIPPNVVCLQNSPRPITVASATEKTIARPNILRCSRQILIRPKPVGHTTLPRLLVPQPVEFIRKKSPTVRSLLSMPRPLNSSPKEGNKLVFPIGMLKKAAMCKQVVTSASDSSSNTSQRPYIIIGSPAATSSRTTTSMSPHHSLPSLGIKK